MPDRKHTKTNEHKVLLGELDKTVSIKDILQLTENISEDVKHLANDLYDFWSDSNGGNINRRQFIKNLSEEMEMYLSSMIITELRERGKI